MLSKIAISLAIAVAIYFGVALGLIASDRPDASPAKAGAGFDFGGARAADYKDLPARKTFTARDGTQLGYRIYKSARPDESASRAGPKRLIILVHGSAWHGMQFHPMAKHLAAQSLGTVVAPDMRGHGPSPKRRGDVDYFGQLEDDMADLIAHLTKGRGKPQIVLGGHSSGGGFVVRFAGGPHGHMAGAFILLAPFLKHDAPTMRKNASGWARPATRRIIGLAMLNMVGIRALNHLPAIGFAMPEPILKGPYGHTATTLYSFRMMAAFAPRPDYEADLRAIRKPLLVVAGSKDEAFRAERFEPVISQHTKTGTYRILPGVNHLGVVSGPEVLPVLTQWLATLGRRPKT
jgi:alpha-beta hydrolase superfamily lysophospholipase